MAEKYCSKIEEVRFSSNRYVLVLPGWYPTLQDPFLGDFNQRQVKAAGLETPQVVLYIVKDQSKTLTGIETRYKQVTENIVEITVTYPAKKNKWIDIFHSNLSYIRLLYEYAEIVRKRWGKPALIHSYIVMRGGLGGLLLGKRWKLPFILSEHWTIYYPADPGYLPKRNFLFNWAVKRVFNNLACFLPVTNNLKQQVDRLIGPVPATIVPNVVDTDLFFYPHPEPEEENFQFIHVSTMTSQKNPQGLLRCFKRFQELHPKTRLQMVGPYPRGVLDYARSLGLIDRQVHFTGAVSYERVAACLKASRALVLFSRYENLPCVILEALCCGLPVISTAVGGIPEVINNNNGILVDSDDDEKLIMAFVKLYTTYNSFNRTEIALKATNAYSYKCIGSLINTVYRSLNLPG
ncbi:MAG: hypothetical protein JWQ40_852 [Segetibacter sp.]|nr:hypothetical protein [Segetibacter sp.]